MCVHRRAHKRNLEASQTGVLFSQAGLQQVQHVGQRAHRLLVREHHAGLAGGEARVAARRLDEAARSGSQPDSEVT